MRPTVIAIEGVMVGRRGVIGIGPIRNLDPSASFLLVSTMNGGETAITRSRAIEVDESWCLHD